jgi:hypothetical protein
MLIWCMYAPARCPRIDTDRNPTKATPYGHDPSALTEVAGFGRCALAAGNLPPPITPRCRHRTCRTRLAIAHAAQPARMAFPAPAGRGSRCDRGRGSGPLWRVAGGVGESGEWAWLADHGARTVVTAGRSALMYVVVAAPVAVAVKLELRTLGIHAGGVRLRRRGMAGLHSGIGANPQSAVEASTSRTSVETPLRPRPRTRRGPPAGPVDRRCRSPPAARPAGHSSSAASVRCRWWRRSAARR